MCGIVGGISDKNIAPLLLNGLNCLEYRGYDSAGIIVLSNNHKFDLARCAASGQTSDLAFVSPKSGSALARHQAGSVANQSVRCGDRGIGTSDNDVTCRVCASGNLSKGGGGGTIA